MNRVISGLTATSGLLAVALAVSPAFAGGAIQATPGSSAYESKSLAATEQSNATASASALGLTSGEKLTVNLKFEKMADFTPAAVARQVPATAKLLEAREQLANLLRYLDGKVAAEDQLKKLLNDPQLMTALNERAAARAIDSDSEK